jgi:small-conductance mechanosensitive channel
MLPNFGIALLTFLLFLFGAWAARASILRFFRYRTRSDLGELLGASAKWTIVTLGLLVVATIIFPSIRPADVLATLGIGSIAIGFAFKDILQNWIAGLLILLRQPFRLGDQIIVNNFEGTVEHIEARGTIIKTYDGRRVVIPNADIYTRALIVNTAFPKRRSEYDVPIDAGGDIERASEVILQAVKDTPGVEAEPAPDVIPWEVGDGEIRLKVRWWTKSERRHVVAARGHVIASVKRALDEAGFPVPYATRVLRFEENPEQAERLTPQGDSGEEADEREARDAAKGPRRH